MKFIGKKIDFTTALIYILNSYDLTIRKIDMENLIESIKNLYEMDEPQNLHQDVQSFMNGRMGTRDQVHLRYALSNEVDFQQENGNSRMAQIAKKALMAFNEGDYKRMKRLVNQIPPN